MRTDMNPVSNYQKFMLAHKYCEKQKCMHYRGHAGEFEVFEDGDTLVFVKTVQVEASFDEAEAKELRKEFESSAFQYFLDGAKICEQPVRCDVLAFRRIDADNVFLRYQTGALE